MAEDLSWLEPGASPRSDYRLRSPRHRARHAPWGLLFLFLAIGAGITIAVLHHLGASLPSPEAEAALAALKKIQARTEIGVTCLDYARVLGEQYAEIRAFLESPQGRRESVRAFGDCLAEAIDAHRAALQDWQRLIESPDSEVWKQAREHDWACARRATQRADEALHGLPLSPRLPEPRPAPHAKGPRYDPTLRGD